MRALVAALLAAAMLAGGCGGTPDGPAVVRIHVGTGERGAFVFLPPARLRPRPVVIFIHGVFGTDPNTYGPWIDHLVREGNFVVYPTYQDTLTPPAAYLANTVAGVREALARVPLKRGSLVVAGHSAGGALAADYAAVARDLRLPAPRAVYAVYPGRRLRGIPFVIPQANPAGVPRTTRIVALAGANDQTVGTSVARQIVRDTTTVPRYRRTFRLITDLRVADHLAPTRTDALARGTFWAPLDRLLRQDP